MAQRPKPAVTLRVQVSPPGRISTPGGTKQGVLVLLSGARPGTMLAITDDEMTVGRTNESTIQIDDESLSRRHVRFFQFQGRYFVEDLKSTNGTFVDGRPVTEPVPLEDGARLQLGGSTVMRFELQDHVVVEETRRLYEATVRDRLTGVFNRHHLDERLHGELSYAKRHGTPLSVLFVDADHFKKVNDTHGHGGGDAVLAALGKLLLDSMRSEDIVARYGGEEFVVALRGINAIGVFGVAERLRNDVENLNIVHEGQRIPITVSIGVATHSPERSFETVAELLAVADGALYKAKEAGRNRVVLA